MSAFILALALAVLGPAQQAGQRIELTNQVLAIMLATAPPGRSRIRDAIETEEAGRQRYAEIARSMVEAAAGKRRGVALLLAISFFESGWRRDVDLGVGPLARGDRGRSCTIFQVNFGRGPRCDALLADRTAAAREALALARMSFAKCRKSPPLEQLAAYASGSCSRGAQVSRMRLTKAEQFLAAMDKFAAR